ncbi:hypothetical protein PC9H_010237 [Pleurotus ostreatus]|uniref:MYND-type domain-containing protein n=1 Tax=Pleurotus ostreatus TaxID=5322 RepID=A0A8H6ZSQ8_PLEOS|nr:uncharacterized protein PC9H_010237 [Pleurotus ostreatus]KAF7424926.1 hypothetical protein PC9H_010237 [Pleurotus ostreatus]KAJ8692045.1 hypothetical protein PTI98_009386 [Pleurotus ostreatus]
MRESNFAFPAQNRACVCITSQLYDRRALDTTSPLPLFNSLTQLVYLTSTSPRIREIMTMDGGLERLVRILHDFCICPPPPENPAMLYGLSPPTARPNKLVPTLNPPSFDKHAAYRFSLAFQCLVNIGVRGSEPIRSRVVQAGTLDVVGCILEAWLANKGFAVGPSASATGMPRETREQRQARRMLQNEQRQRQDVDELYRALIRQQMEQQAEGRSAEPEDEAMEDNTATARDSNSQLSASRPGTSESQSNSDTDTSTDTSANTTPIGSTTPTTTVLVPGRERSGTVIGRRVWDDAPAQPTPPHTATRQRTIRARPSLVEHLRASPTPSSDTSRPETETEDDGDAEGDLDADRDGDINMDRRRRLRQAIVPSASPSPERRPSVSITRPTRRTVGIVSDDPPATSIIITDAGGSVDVVAVGGDGGVEEGIVSLDQNDDFAMGAPPGAPGAIDDGTGGRRVDLDLGLGAPERRLSIPGVNGPDITPRAGLVNLPAVPSGDHRGAQGQTPRGRGVAADGRRLIDPSTFPPQLTATVPTPVSLNTRASPSHHHRDTDSGPYRDEDVVLSLQLLAYLSKYPHVRQAFYKPRLSFHPASAQLPGRSYPGGVQASEPDTSRATGKAPTATMKDTLLRTFGRGKEKERANASVYGSSIAGPSSSTTSSTNPIPSTTNGPSPSSSAYKAFTSSPNPQPVRQTNVFSLVERFTFRPSASESDLPNAPPKLPQEIQYWAGVIMRNACRKDESRGGIRQCANMLCGRWESYPREFAKCRRCRKAKYCGKECQSTAWSEGHRFWCSAKDGDDETVHAHDSGSRNTVAAAAAGVASAAPGITPTPDTEGVGAVRVTIMGDAADTATGDIGTTGEGLAVTAGGTIRAGTRQRVMALEPRARPSLPGQHERTEDALVFAGLRVGGAGRNIGPNGMDVDPNGNILRTMFAAAPGTTTMNATTGRTRRADEIQAPPSYRSVYGGLGTLPTPEQRAARRQNNDYDPREVAEILAMYTHPPGRAMTIAQNNPMRMRRLEQLRIQMAEQQASGSTDPYSPSSTSPTQASPRRRLTGPSSETLNIPSTVDSTPTSGTVSPTARRPTLDELRRHYQATEADQDMVMG